MSTTSTAVICTGKGQAAVKEVPVPSIREGHILVKVKAVGLNPTDWKSIHSGGAEGKKIGVCIPRLSRAAAIVFLRTRDHGAPVRTQVADTRQCDYAGVVEEVGPGVTKPLKKGDRVCGFAHGG